MDSRFTPALRSRRSSFRSTLSGLASRVISASLDKVNFFLTAPNSSSKRFSP